MLSHIKNVYVEQTPSGDCRTLHTLGLFNIQKEVYAKMTCKMNSNNIKGKFSKTACSE